MPKKGELTTPEIKFKISATKELNKNKQETRGCFVCAKPLKYWQRKFCCLGHKGLFYSGINHPMWEGGLSIAKMPCDNCGKNIMASSKNHLCRKCFNK